MNFMFEARFCSVVGVYPANTLKCNKVQSGSHGKPTPQNFDIENGQDGDKAADTARSIKLEFEPNDIRFWFAQLEDEMTMATVKSQWLKKTDL